MIKAIVRNEFFRAAAAFVMIFMITFLFIFAAERDTMQYYGCELKYNSDKAADTFYETLTAESQEAQLKIFSIRNLEGFRDVYADAESEEDISALLVGMISYSNADILWIRTQYAKPGKYADTVFNDSQFMVFMDHYYAPYGEYGAYVADLIKTNEKMLTRSSTSGYDRAVCEYELTLLERIDQTPDDVPVVSGANTFTERFNGDMIFAFFVSLLCYRMFTAHRRTGYITCIKTMKCGLKRFIISQNISHIIMFTAAYLLYALLYFLMMSRYLGDFSILNSPIQLLQATEYSVYPLTVLQYMLILLAGRYLYFLALCCIFGFISMISPHDLISLAAGVIISALPLIFSLSGINGFAADIISGNITSFIDRSDITVLFGKGAPVLLIVLCGYLLIAVIFFLLTYLAGHLQFRTVRGKAAANV